MKNVPFLVLLAAAVAPIAAGDDTTVRFDTRARGEEKAIRHWGIDATWASPPNTRESMRHGEPLIEFVRIGFYMHEPLGEDGNLSRGQIGKLGEALACAKIVARDVPIMLSPHNEEGIIDWYKNPDGSAHLDRWFQVMARTREWVESQGHHVAMIEAFNEPDYEKWNMGTREDLDELSKRMKAWEVQRVGPSTMSTQWAESWYGAIHRNVDVGSTHTLYGTMREFIDLAKEVKRDRNRFFCPESHSIAEVMVGAEVGVDYAAWWGPINEARGRFMRACQGKRLAYEAVEENWSAGCVYRAPDGSLHAFVGSTERENGKTTGYRFICTNEDVTYFPDGNRTRGQPRKRGQAFAVVAKPPEGERSQWIEIVPMNRLPPR
jgi:hypothetical protein